MAEPASMSTEKKNDFFGRLGKYDLLKKSS